MSVASSLALGFTGFLVYNAEPGSSFFSYHPVLMTIAYCLLTFEAVQIFNKSNPLRNWLPVRNITFHWTLATLALACISCGMYVVYEHKEALGKPHFTSLHSKFGIVANTGLFCVAMGGVLTLYRKNLGLPSIIKKGHMIAAVVVYLTAVCALLTGLSSNWFSHVVMVSAPGYWRTVYVLPVLAGFVIAMQVAKKLLSKQAAASQKDSSASVSKDRCRQD